MRAVRNIVIILVTAAIVDLVPGGGTAANTILTAMTMAFLMALAFFVYRLFRENQLTLATLTETRRAILLGAVGLIALLIAGSSKLFSTPAGTLAWIVLLALAVVAIARVWIDANRYT
jgi:hypothetical protein